MAFRRSVASRAKILYQQQQRLSVPFSHIGRDDDGDREGGDILRRRLFGGGVNMGSLCGSRNMFHGRRFAAPFSARNMSTFGEGAGADKLEIMTDVLGKTAAEAASQVVPVANEVAVAAADSFFPVAALQHMIDYVHTFTGLDWWASIVVATLLIRTLILPFTIHQIIAASKIGIEEILVNIWSMVRVIRSRDMDPAAVAECIARLKFFLNEYGVTLFFVAMGDIIGFSFSCCFFFGLSNMAEKVQSFKDGGALWFTDLTTPDAMYILPVLTALTFWMKRVVDPKKGLKGSPVAYTDKIKITSMVSAALTIPLAAIFPKAILCYIITSNLHSLAFGLVMMQPEVWKMLGIVSKPPPPPSPPSTSA